MKGTANLASGHLCTCAYVPATVCSERSEFAVSPQRCPLMLKQERPKQNVKAFNKIWTFHCVYSLYVFIEVKVKALCLVCGEEVAVFKEYILKPCYVTKYAEKYKNLTDAEQVWTSETLRAKLKRQQRLYIELYTSKDGEVKYSFVIFSKITKNC